MFTKAFRVKSNTVIKGSDRRKLKVDVSTAFPLLSESELSEVVPNKEEINVVKVYAHKGDAITLYVLHKNPLFFELEKRLYPTVYMLWQYPNVLPSFATWAPVIQKIAGGADLMLPGVVVPSCGLPEVRQGECCVVKVVGNEAPMAVGIAAMSTAEMSSAGMKGRGVSMDALLLQCFLHALKSKVKKSELPLLTSSFLRNHMFPCCPNGKQLDIKKSSYKKLSKFLQTMQQQHRVVRVKELTKGVESLVEVDWKNPVKGTVLQPGEVRAIITEYVKANELVDENNKNYVHINPILCDCLLEKSEYHEVSILKWDDLFSRTLSKMQECSQFVIAGQQPIMKKGHIEPIDITVASRGSNKKVGVHQCLTVNSHLL
uniref:Eukaryotic translation initiation factor 2D n=1 Tax=Gadus morhua TaxID=8049 RepID=A0A8C5BDR1_GADMO